MHSPYYAAGKLLSLQKFGGLDLEFSSPEELEAHRSRRRMVGNATGLVGSIAGGGAGMAAGGPLGAMAGSMAGQLAKVPGQTLMDVAHDIPQKTKATYDGTLGRLERAGGFGYRVAACLGELEDVPAEFAAFAREDNTQSLATPAAEIDPLDARLQPPGWGPTTSVDAGSAGSNMMPTMGAGGAV